MKQLIITGPKQARFDETAMPACAQGGVVIRARVTAISTGTELRVFRAIPVDEAGQFLHERFPFRLPVENGYSMVGDVIEVGADVEEIDVGDRVFATAAHGQFAAVDATEVTRLPDTIPDEEAAMLNILEVAHCALRRADPAVGSNVAIVGQGVIGLSLTAYADAFGFRTVVVDSVVERLQVAEQMGVLLAASTGEQDRYDRIRELFDGQGADVTFEATSQWSGIRAAMEITRTDGTVVVVSRQLHIPDFNPVGHPFLGKSLSLITSYGYQATGSRWSGRRSFSLTVDLLARRRLKIRPMLTHRFSWQELPDVYQRLDEGDRSIVGAIIDWTSV